jgi:N6-L-threonylcarbamoyladenine synthase
VARDGDPQRFPFPPVLQGQDGHDLSFSGLKTALLRRVRELGAELPEARADLAAAFQAAIVRQLVERAVAALDATGRTRLAIVGGVAANDALRGALADACAERGARLSLLPPARASTTRP